jgi:hypothetical protein
MSSKMGGNSRINGSDLDKNNILKPTLNTLMEEGHKVFEAYHTNLEELFCRCPTDRVPLHTSLKSREAVGHASTHCHVSYGSGPRLQAEVGSGATMCPMAPDLASQLRWALVLPHALQFRTSPNS